MEEKMKTQDVRLSKTAIRQIYQNLREIIIIYIVSTMSII